MGRTSPFTTGHDAELFRKAAEALEATLAELTEENNED
jgi:hypothetical protein